MASIDNRRIKELKRYRTRKALHVVKSIISTYEIDVWSYFSAVEEYYELIKSNASESEIQQYRKNLFYWLCDLGRTKDDFESLPTFEEIFEVMAYIKSLIDLLLIMPTVQVSYVNSEIEIEINPPPEIIADLSIFNI